ncbi:hypothetical protein FA048_18940 [Pedobacter polaris]|uniref:Rieske domain-containing protein n=1 Tax=Pedobacter polaris TaxID=2571273 RepID=A0A4U1CES1_9SPHI|nr:hypothetical protein [Pedobacter polaris]TKC04759.1 hypothetical protein FA048_18940 [Pedobacter polaris]
MKRLLGLLMLFLVASCGKEEYNIPDVPVNYNVTLVEFGIKAVNNVLLVPNKGVAGLIIIRTPNGFVAFDRCSTVNPEKACSINPDDSGFTATDPCTGAKFSLLDGSPQKAPAERNLKSYRVSQNNSTLYITN